MRDVHPRVARQLLRLDDPADKETLVDQYGAVWQYGGARAPVLVSRLRLRQARVQLGSRPAPRQPRRPR